MSMTADKNSSAKLQKKITGTLLGNGVVVGAIGIHAFIDLRTDPTPLLGISRHIALGVPLIAIAALILFSGVSLLMTSKTNFARLGIGAAGLPPLFCVIGRYFTDVQVLSSVVPVLLAVFPALLAPRVLKLVKA